MATHHAARPPNQPASFIDLTSSDDDEAQALATQIQPSQALASQVAQDLLPSNHGLPLQGAFTQNQCGGTNNGDGPAFNTCEPTVGGFGARPQTSIRPQTNNPNAGRRSTAQSFPRTIITATDRRMSVEENPAKKRKTHGGSGMTLKPYGGGLISQETPAAASGRALSTQLPKGSPASESTSPQDIQRVPVAVRLRADKLRVPLNGRGQNAQNLPRASVPISQQPDKIYDVICQQVVEHINSALDQYRSSISKADRRSIGGWVAKELVRGNDFVENLVPNEWKLSAQYEKKLSTEAHSLVDKYASEVLNSMAPESKPLMETESRNNSEEMSTAERSGHGTSKRLASPSTCSESEEEIFESPSAVEQKYFPRSRHSSSSPTTSFSNDAATSPMDLDSHDEILVPQVSKRRSLRKLRSSKPRPTSTQPSRSNAQSDSESEHSPGVRQQKLDISVLREIQALRLAGGDKSIDRPYLSFRDREDIRHGCEISNLSRSERELLRQSLFHVDFCLEELEFLCKIIQAIKEDTLPLSDVRSQIITLMSGQENLIPKVLSLFQKLLNLPGQELGRILLRNRETAAIRALLCDAVEGKIATMPRLARIETVPRQTKTTATPISSLLRQREVYGLTPIRIRRGQQSFKVEIASHLEDTLVRKSEWTDCCGDISTLSWTGEGAFVCGATAHSDFFNMQYNKPGNFAVGSSSLDTLRAVADHRIPRPIVASSENADNAQDSMRQTQDPWLYTSVVSSSYCEVNGYTFTASFDHTVRVWKVAENGSSIDLRGTWPHDGKVNFVVSSSHHERLATASDVSNNAIRVYNLEEEDISNSRPDFYSGEKAIEQSQELFRRDKWAYHPATIQWGKAPGVADFLLVGYSPRSETGHDVDIPEDKKNTGELCLWNVEAGTRIPISSARTQNVFEVMWHPTQPCFLAATSPCGTFEPETKTQIRLFAQNEFGSWLHIKALDCPASDINELTIMPNSPVQCYVTASCTDGNTYVWDSAQTDRPIHTLGHGESLDLDNLTHDQSRESTDTGVKFAAWGKSPNRFYTGSSDGEVKAWDIRKPRGHAFVRTVLSVSGGISTGAFSRNFSKLLIGDATGKVHLLELNNNDDSSDAESETTNAPFLASAILGRGSKVLVSHPEPHCAPFRVKKPKVIIPHPEPPPPADFGLKAEDEEEETAQDIAQSYISEGKLAMHGGIGAVQSHNYAKTGLFRKEAHEDNDPTLPLLPHYQAKQQYEIQRQDDRLKLPCLPQITSSDQSLHERNLSVDLDFAQLSLSEELKRDGVDLDFEPAKNFEYELLPSFSIFKMPKKHQKRTHNI